MGCTKNILPLWRNVLTMLVTCKELHSSIKKGSIGTPLSWRSHFHGGMPIDTLPRWRFTSMKAGPLALHFHKRRSKSVNEPLQRRHVHWHPTSTKEPLPQNRVHWHPTSMNEPLPWRHVLHYQRLICHHREMSYHFYPHHSSYKSLKVPLFTHSWGGKRGMLG